MPVALNGVRRLVALPGSFNPPHAAHLALLAAALRSCQADAAALVLSVRTVDKEQVSGMLLEDRLWLLCQLLPSRESEHLPGVEGDTQIGRRTSVVVVNRGLYYEQALALRRLCPQLEHLWFVTGYDKIVQIFDPRYYDDRERALRLLFEHAAFLVAPREGYDHSDLDTLLARPENAPYAARVQPLSLDPSLAQVSSTRVRQASASTQAPDKADTHDDVPELVARFIQQSGCYGPDPGPYRARGAALRAGA